KGQQELLAQVSARINQIHTLAKGLRSVREQTNAFVARAGIDAVTQAGNALVRKVDGVEERLINPKSKTFQDVINFRNGLNDQYLSLADAVDGTDAPVTQGMRTRLADLEAMWAQLRPEVEGILGAELERFNALVRERGVPAIVVK